MPKTSARLRAVKKDAVLEGAVDVARAGAEAVAHPRPVGEHVGFEMVSERLATHYFASTDAGYVGWCWAVTVARVPRGRVATVCEVDMTPREGALLAPEWVPWEDRLRPSDISRDDVLPYKADDERLPREDGRGHAHDVWRVCERVGDRRRRCGLSGSHMWFPLGD